MLQSLSTYVCFDVIGGIELHRSFRLVLRSSSEGDSISKSFIALLDWGLR